MGVKLILPELLRFRILIDFVSYYTAARGYDAVNIYHLANLESIAENMHLMRSIEVVYQRIYPYLYPPVLAFYLQPLAQLKYALAYRVWLVFTWALIPLVVWQTLSLGTNLSNPHHRPAWIAASTAMIFLYTLPFDMDINQGQVNIFLLSLLLTSFYLTFVRKREGLAGGALALAALVKVTPAFLLTFFFLSKKRRVILGFLGGGFLLILPTLFGQGIAQWKHFFTFVLTASQTYEITNLRDPGMVSNISLLGALTRLGLSQTWAYGGDVLLLILLAGPIWVLHYRVQGQPFPGFGLLTAYLTVMILAAPYAWIVHLIYLYPALVWAFSRELSPEARDAVPRYVLVLLFLFTLLAGVDFPELYDQFPLLRAIPPALRSLNTFSLLAIYAIGLYLGWQETREAPHRGTPTVKT